jgi:hypothetical protein
VVSLWGATRALLSLAELVVRQVVALQAVFQAGRCHTRHKISRQGEWDGGSWDKA